MCLLCVCVNVYVCDLLFMYTVVRLFDVYMCGFVLLYVLLCFLVYFLLLCVYGFCVYVRVSQFC